MTMVHAQEMEPVAVTSVESPDAPQGDVEIGKQGEMQQELMEAARQFAEELKAALQQAAAQAQTEAPQDVEADDETPAVLAKIGPKEENVVQEAKEVA